jgi:hypothetical protein
MSSSRSAGESTPLLKDTDRADTVEGTPQNHPTADEEAQAEPHDASAAPQEQSSRSRKLNSIILAILVVLPVLHLILLGIIWLMHSYGSSQYGASDWFIDYELPPLSFIVRWPLPFDSLLLLPFVLDLSSANLRSTTRPSLLLS